MELRRVTDGIPVFIHIPKTGGSSLRTLIAANYLNDPFRDHSPEVEAPSILENRLLNLYGGPAEVFNYCLDIPRGDRAGLRMVQGHVGYGVHDYLGLQNPKYFFLMREPMRRMVSEIEHATRHPSHNLYNLFADPNATLAQRIEIAKSLPNFRNTTTNFLSGTYGTRDATITDFHLALRRVRSSEFVGITEQSELSFLMIGRRLGWKHVIPHKCNVAPLGNDEISKSDYESCSSVLGYDIQLYRAAVDRFEEEVAVHGSLLLDAAEQLKELIQEQQVRNTGDQHETFMIGQPLRIPLTRYTEEIPRNSPLYHWIR